MGQKHKRKPLSKSEIKDLNKVIEDFGIEFGKKERIELVDDMFYFKDDDCAFFLHEKELVPSLKFVLKNSFPMKTIIVDMGAVRYIVNGADVMRPGIKEIDPDIAKNDIVVIKDEVNLKPIVIGIALSSSQEMKEQTDGKAIQNIHYVGDSIWNFEL